MHKSDGVMKCALLTVLLSSVATNTMAIDTKKLAQMQPVSTVADTQSAARRTGAVTIGAINWTCSKARCSTLSSVVAPLAACQGLAREVGAIRSFAIANHLLNGNELQQCNSVVVVATAMPSAKIAQGVGIAAAAPAPGVALPPLQSPPVLKSPLPVAVISPPSPPVADSTKKPFGAKSFPPFAAPTKGTPAPAPAPLPAPPITPRPVVPFAPVALRTPLLTITGIGVAEESFRFTPVAVRTPPLTLTGVGIAEVSFRFTPVAVRTPPLTITGTGRSE